MDFRKIIAGKKEVSAETIKNSLAAALKKHRKSGHNGYRIPNFYTVELSDNDYKNLVNKALYDDVFCFIVQWLITTDTFMDDKLELKFALNESFKAGKIAVDCRYSGESEAHNDVVSSNTIIMDTRAVTVPLLLSATHKIATLKVLKGPDRDLFAYLGEKKLLIGRREKSDILLSDNTVSRIHASIVFDRNRHVLYDTESLNGTYVNGKAVKEKVLQENDEILVGNTLLVYQTAE